MPLVQEEPMFLPQSNWKNLVKWYDPNPPKLGDNQAGAKQILRLWQNSQACYHQPHHKAAAKTQKIQD